MALVLAPCVKPIIFNKFSIKISFDKIIFIKRKAERGEILC